MIDAAKIRFLLIGPHATTEATVRAAVADVLRACEANGVVGGEELIVLETAWQRLAQQRREVALREGYFDHEVEEQRDRLRRLDALVADDTADRYDTDEGGRLVWRGHTESVIQVLSDPRLPERVEDVAGTPDAA